MEDKSAQAIAEDIITTFSFEAVRVADSRVPENVRDGKCSGVEFWTQVGGAVRPLACEGLLLGEPS